MLILASNSPRRKQLLSLGGWEFSVTPAQVDERVLPGELAQNYVRRLAETKARAVSDLDGLPAGALVVAADTAVVDGESILGKPVDAQDAAAMLRSLRGRAHQVFTGLAALAADGRMLSDVCRSEVIMRAYSDAEMQVYIASGDPLDKAGAYAIQHAGFRPVARLQGCYANVMGLPLCSLAALLAELGVQAKNDIIAACQQILDAPCQVYMQATGVLE